MSLSWDFLDIVQIIWSEKKCSNFLWTDNGIQITQALRNTTSEGMMATNNNLLLMKEMLFKAG